MTRSKAIAALILVLSAWVCYAQEKNFIDLPYIATSALVDTLITPDRIYLNILVLERDTKGKVSVEELESRLVAALKTLGINTERNLMLMDVGSNFKSYFVKNRDILKSKAYSLLVANALEAGKVILALEEIEISNVTVDRTEYSRKEEILLGLRAKAVKKAQLNARYMAGELGQKIGGAIYISDVQSDPAFLQGRAPGVEIRGYSLKQAQGYEKLAAIEFEKLRFEASVQVKFKLLD